MIACIGWGSLIWRPDGLPLGGPWEEDGPKLPVEFARQSSDGRVTLVIVETSQPIETLWAPMETTDLDVAREQLKDREGTVISRIAVQTLDGPIGPSQAHQIVHDWLRVRQLDAAIWTALGPRWRGEDGVVPTSDALLNYLRSLTGSTAEKAEEYVRSAPRQIRTALRAVMEDHLGWVPI